MTRFGPGHRVRVRDDWPELAGRAHVRTPHYIRGRTGTVLRHLGSFRNPADLAFGRVPAILPLYHVAFPQDAIWPENQPGDEFLVEVYENWLEAA
jgi:nitrile hydratase